MKQLIRHQDRLSLCCGFTGFGREATLVKHHDVPGAAGLVMPGPTSTQMSFAIGIIQQGAIGGLLSGQYIYVLFRLSFLL